MYQYFRSKNQELSKKYHIPYPAIMAHRGLSFYAPEETLPAYLLALEIGSYLYLEADIQRTRDGVLVCFHDDHLKRTTNVEEVFPERSNGGIGDFTYQELLQLDMGSWFNQKYPHRARKSFHKLKILTLEELAEIAKTKPNRGLYLETKSAHKYPGIEKEIVTLLHKKGWLLPSEVNPDYIPRFSSSFQRREDGFAKVIFQSFELKSLQKFKLYAPKIPIVLLIDEKMENQHGGYKQLIQIAKQIHAHLGPSGYMGFPWNQYWANQEEILVHHYTINEKYQMAILNFFGSGGIFTDKANLALEYYYPDQYPDIPIEKLFEKIGY